MTDLITDYDQGTRASVARSRATTVPSAAIRTPRQLQLALRLFF